MAADAARNGYVAETVGGGGGHQPADVDRLLADGAGEDDAALLLDAARREVERLRKSLQAADDAHFVAGTLDADRYARTVQRLQAEIANRQAEIQQAEARQAREAEQGSRRDRLMDVLRNGPAILASADPTAANVWLRTHLRVWVHERRVLIVEWL